MMFRHDHRADSHGTIQPTPPKTLQAPEIGGHGAIDAIMVLALALAILTGGKARSTSRARG